MESFILFNKHLLLHITSLTQAIKKRVYLICTSVHANLFFTLPSVPFSPPLLHLDGFEVESGVDIVQLTVKGVERGPFGSLRVPAFHHNAVDVWGAAIWTR